MIVALSIRSFVLIDRLDLKASSGFTALTGETGAGKSIILDALGLVLGGAVDRGSIRHGCDSASITAEFAPPKGHAVWAALASEGLDVTPDETLILHRVISKKGPSRSALNGVPVSAALMARIGIWLVEIHGQHASAALMRPSYHREVLDKYAGSETLAQKCKAAWEEYQKHCADLANLESEQAAAQRDRDWLVFALEDLGKLAPEAGEIEQLMEVRQHLSRSGKTAAAIKQARSTLKDAAVETALVKASKAIEKLVPDTDAGSSDFTAKTQQAALALERTLIELSEANEALDALGRAAQHDPGLQDRTDARLSELRAAARKYNTIPEHLYDHMLHLKKRLDCCDASKEALEAAQGLVDASYDAWMKIADALDKKRRSGAGRLEKAIAAELGPLQMKRVKMQVSFEPLKPGQSGAFGAHAIEFLVETNPGAGFGKLRKTASGGELARFTLALQCALSTANQNQVQIFDEVDQGVGGAVAAAIGERLSKLGESRQVFAITHSPQVASRAARQWRIRKSGGVKKPVTTHVVQLDDGQRLEEIARMLSGTEVTEEARAAAMKLLEAA